VNKLDGNKSHLKESLCVHPFTLFRQDTHTFDLLFCASQEVRDAILGVHTHLHHEVGWRQRHGARCLAPIYGKKNAVIWFWLAKLACVVLHESEIEIGD
jgi:hypothetical protein